MDGHRGDNQKFVEGILRTRAQASHVGQKRKRHVRVRTWGQCQNQPVWARTWGGGGGGSGVQGFRDKLTTTSQVGVCSMRGGIPQARRHGDTGGKASNREGGEGRILVDTAAIVGGRRSSGEDTLSARMGCRESYLGRRRRQGSEDIQQIWKPPQMADTGHSRSGG